MRILPILFLLFSAPLAWAEVSTFQLQNGMQVWVLPNHRAPVVLNQICYKIGSADEVEGKTGLAHMLEHMMFKGTPSHPAGEADKMIAQLGGNQNAFTGTDYTCYYQEIAKQHLEDMLKLEADRMQHLNFNEAEFKKELEVVKEERRMRLDDNPEAVTFERLAAISLLRSPYQHQPIGWMDDLNRMTMNDAADWYHRWYHPNNAVLIVVGDVEPQEVFKQAQRQFGLIPSKPIQRNETKLSIPFHNQKLIAVKIPAKLPKLLIGYPTPSLTTAENKRDAYALALLNFLLTGNESSRLNKQFVRDEKIALAIDSDYGLHKRFSDLMVFEIVPTRDHTLIQVEKALDQSIEKLQKEYVSEEELRRVKKQMIADKIYAQDSLSYQAHELGALAAMGLSWETKNDFIKEIQAVNAKDIQRVAQKYLIQENKTVAQLIPTDLKARG